MKSLKAEIAGAREQIVEIENTRKLAQAQKQRLVRLIKTAPILKTLARLREDFAAFDNLAALPSDWAQNLGRVLLAQEQGAEAAARAAQTQEAARLECEDAVVDELLLAQAEKIEDLIRASGAYESSPPPTCRVAKTRCARPARPCSVAPRNAACQTRKACAPPRRTRAC